jgi:hypothetical protein
MNTANNPDYEKGRASLQFFHNAAVEFEAYPFAFEAMINKYHPAVIEGIGLAINSAEISEPRVRDAMADVARLFYASQEEPISGSLPHQSMFFNQLTNRAGEVRFLETVSAVGVATASDLGEGLAETGDIVLATAKQTALALPLILLIGVAVFAYVKGKSPV